MRKPNTTHDDAISSLYRSGLDCYVIGQQVGVHRRTVAAALKRLGIALRPVGYSGPTAFDPARNAAIRAARARGVTLAEIGRQYGISRQRVYQLTQPTRVTLESSLAARQEQANE